jgi:hypothetical protein
MALLLMSVMAATRLLRAFFHRDGSIPLGQGRATYSMGLGNAAVEALRLGLRALKCQDEGLASRTSASNGSLAKHKRLSCFSRKLSAAITNDNILLSWCTRHCIVRPGDLQRYESVMELGCAYGGIILLLTTSRHLLP